MIYPRVQDAVLNFKEKYCPAGYNKTRVSYVWFGWVSRGVRVWVHRWMGG